VVSTNDLYGGTYRLFTKIFEGFGMKFNFVDMGDPANVAAAITPKTKLVWVETPTNPRCASSTSPPWPSSPKARTLPAGVDNTFASPYLAEPDGPGRGHRDALVTKFLGGHSDVVMGALVVNDDAWPSAWPSSRTAAAPRPVRRIASWCCVA
jgi:cystathionine beta-lyase/cystathionine gamma-synthase